MRRLISIITVGFLFSFIVTLATYFYPYITPSNDFAVKLVNRGLPLPWAVESHGKTSVHPPAGVYPLDFLELSFLIDVIFWTEVFLLPPIIYLYWKGLRQFRKRGDLKEKSLFP